MRKKILLSITLFISFIYQLNASNNTVKNRIRLSVLPIGYYTYVASPSKNVHNYFNGGLNEVSVSYEYIPFKKIGFDVFFNFTGRKFENYKEDDHSFVRFYGNPGFTAGICGVFHPFTVERKIDLYIRYGLGFAADFGDGPTLFPGFAGASSLGANYKISKKFGLGVEANAHYSTYKGGAYKDDSESTRFPFELAFIDIGISACYYF